MNQLFGLFRANGTGPPSSGSQQGHFGRQFGEEPFRPPAAPFGQGGFGSGASEAPGNSGLDALSKTEKWLPGLPKAGHESWRDRESEIAGFHRYLVELRSWASLVNPKFAAEIAEAAVTDKEIILSALSRDPQGRSGRLLAILRAAFSGHGRAKNIIRAFGEGITIAGLGTSNYNDNGLDCCES